MPSGCRKGVSSSIAFGNCETVLRYGRRTKEQLRKEVTKENKRAPKTFYGRRRHTLVDRRSTRHRIQNNFLIAGLKKDHLLMAFLSSQLLNNIRHPKSGVYFARSMK